jgi:hypothetical protein
VTYDLERLRAGRLSEAIYGRPGTRTAQGQIYHRAGHPEKDHDQAPGKVRNDTAGHGETLLRPPPPGNDQEPHMTRAT